jgi:hypothetical protein
MAIREMMPNHRWPGVIQHRPGLTEIITPRALSKFMGMPISTKTIRLKGLREVAVGIGIVTSRRAAPAIASKASKGDRKRLPTAIGAVACAGGITIRSGQMHAQRYKAPQAVAKFRNTEDGCIKVALKPF